MGILIATSIVQGGPGFPVLAPHIYEYITTGDYLNASAGITIRDFPDPEVRHLLAEVSTEWKARKLIVLYEGPVHMFVRNATGMQSVQIRFLWMWYCIHFDCYP